MRQKYLIGTLFIILYANTYAHNTQPIDTTKWLCTYSYEFLQDSTNNLSRKQALMYLQIGAHSSKFFDQGSFVGDSILFSNANFDINTASTSEIINFTNKISKAPMVNILASFSVYKNFPKSGFMSFIAYGDGKSCKVVQPMQIKWKLDSSKDTTILGYRCQRAHTSYAGRAYTAWYTTQIPINDGPYKFNGLPGLILIIYDSKNEHRFTITSVKRLKYSQPILYANINYTQLTAEEFVKVLRNKISKLFGKVQSGEIVPINEEAKARSLQGLKAKNNFIEKF